MEYVEARNVRFSNIFESTELVHFQPQNDFSIPDDGILIIKDLGDDLIEELSDVEREMINETDEPVYVVLTGVDSTNVDAQIEYSGEAIFLDYKPTKDEIIKELM